MMTINVDSGWQRNKKVEQLHQDFLKFSSKMIYEIHIFKIIVIRGWTNKLFCLKDMEQSNEFYFDHASKFILSGLYIV